MHEIRGSHSPWLVVPSLLNKRSNKKHVLNISSAFLPCTNTTVKGCLLEEVGTHVNDVKKNH